MEILLVQTLDQEMIIHMEQVSVSGSFQALEFCEDPCNLYNHDLDSKLKD